MITARLDAARVGSRPSHEAPREQHAYETRRLQG